MHPDGIREISQYVLTHFHQRTHSLRASGAGFNAMFAVSSMDAAKLHYQALNKLQVDSERPLRIATFYSFAANEEQDAVGDTQDESFDVSAMNSSATEFFKSGIANYNGSFNISCGLGRLHSLCNIATKYCTKKPDN